MNEEKIIKNSIKQAIITIVCVIANVYGGHFAVNHSLPFWLDSVGTVFSAYLYGPVCGAIVGAGSNIISSFLYGTYIIYLITSILIGIIVGLATRKGALENFFGSMVLATILTAVSMGISIPLNAITENGMTGNPWGDAVIEYLKKQGLGILRYPIGQYYLEFLDKTITILILFLSIHISRYIRKILRARKEKKLLAKAMLLALFFSSIFFSKENIYAANKAWEGITEESLSTDYSSYIQTIYDNTNGLPCGEANDIATTNDGILWVGTYAGLYRYSGRDFQHMDSYDSVKNVNCLYVDNEGRLWIGTNDNGLSIAIDDKISNVLTSENELPSDSVRSIGGGKNGIYYVGTSDGLTMISLAGGIHIVKILREIKDVISIDDDGNGNVACVTASGGLYFISDGTVVKNILWNEENSYTAVKFSNDGRLFAGTRGNELAVFSVTDNSIQYSSSVFVDGIRQINDIYISESSKNIFLCSDEGIGYFDAQNVFHTLPTGSFNNSIEAMTMDYQGDLWFASSRMGLLKLAYSGISDVFQSSGLESTVVNTISEWNGKLYIGTDTGLFIIDKNTNAVLSDNVSEMLSGVRIRCNFSSVDGSLFICTDGNGTYRISPDGSILNYNSSNGAFGDKARVAIQFNDSVLVAGSGGLSFIDSAGNLSNTIKTEEGAAKILCLTAIDDNTVLAGTDGDGILVVKYQTIYDHITKEDGLSSNVVLKIPKTGADIFAVTSNGICYSEDGLDYTYISNFPYSNNFDIFFDDKGSAFVAGSAGIYVTEEKSLKENSENMNAELWNANQGFLAAFTANAYNYLDKDDNYYLASSKGVYKFNLSTYKGDYHTYRISIAKAVVDGSEYKLENGLSFKLTSDAKKVTILPEVINYTTENPYVRYTLEGYDKKYFEVSLSDLGEITYNNLPSGTYTFNLSILNRDRQEIIEQTKMVFVKEKSLYDEGYFNFYLFGIAGASIAWFTWLIFRTQIGKTLKMQMREVEIAKNQVKMGNETILTIAKALDARDERTSKHSERVSEYSVKIARKMGFSAAECENLRKAALLHDIGKVGIPDSILNKPSRLTDDEYDIMKTHVTKGADILKNFTGIDHVVEGALYHHERYDGTGYMTGLKGKDIPLYGRIIGVADAFDAMTANRVYRKQLDIDYVLEELVRCSGTQFDPEIADIMISLVADGEVDIEEIYNSKENRESEGNK